MKQANDNVNLVDLKFELTEKMTQIEKYLGKELIITSGYRSPDHPIEAKKEKPGEHSEGYAVDVYCKLPSDFYNLTAAACRFGVKRIGISRKKNFIHLGFNPERPTSVWVY